MPRKSQIAMGILAALALTDGVRTRLKFQVLNTSYQEIQLKLLQENALNLLEIDHLYRKLEEHDIPVDDFDLIALNYRRQQEE